MKSPVLSLLVAVGLIGSASATYLINEDFSSVSGVDLNTNSTIWSHNGLNWVWSKIDGTTSPGAYEVYDSSNAFTRISYAVSGIAQEIHGGLEIESDPFPNGSTWQVAVQVKKGFNETNGYISFDFGYRSFQTAGKFAVYDVTKRSYLLNFYDLTPLTNPNQWTHAAFYVNLPSFNDVIELQWRDTISTHIAGEGLEVAAVSFNAVPDPPTNALAESTTYISGSTAFSYALVPAITNWISTRGGILIATDTTNLVSTNLFSTKALVASYTNDYGITCYICMRLTGSEAGIQSAASPAGTNLIAFPATNTAKTIGGLDASDYTVYTNATVVLSDTWQYASRFNWTYGGVTYAALARAPGSGAGGVIGVTTYNWVASSNFPTYATNVTGQFARLLLTSGKAPLALMTGSLSDSNNGCYLVGRDIDSGARIATFLSTGFGVLASTKQYALGTNFTTSSAGTTILGNPATDTNKIFLWPVESVDGISSGSIGNGGYGSGITLCSLMTNALARGTNLVVVANSTSNGVLATNVRSTYTGTNYLIGYALRRDADAKTNDGLVLLGYDGKANTTNNVAYGGYTFWGYEHLYMGVNTNADDVAVATGLSGIIPTFLTAPDIPLTAMKVLRSTDGGTVSGNY